MPESTALILGSGFADLLDDTPLEAPLTAYGTASAPLRTLDIGGCRVLALARHGEDHAIPPHAINYRANVAALDAAGVGAIVALNTVGVIGDIVGPAEIAVPEQLLDYTWGREHTYFTGGNAGVEHIEFTAPFPAALRRRLLEAAARAGVRCHDGGVYAATQGPRLETAAEIDRLERDGADYVGMTAMPEAALAAERGIDYACLALAVNRAAGRGDTPIHDDVAENSAAARALALELLRCFFADAASRDDG